MKEFAGNKPFATIRAQCKAAGIDLNDKLLKQGSDYVAITTIKGNNRSGQVLYNTFNGTFFGTTPDGVEFDSSKTTHEAEPWFQALLSFFFVEKQDDPGVLGGTRVLPKPKATAVDYTLGTTALLEKA